MSLEAEGSAPAAAAPAAPAAEAGNPASSNAAPATNGSQAGAQPDWWNGLQGEGNRAVVEAKGWKAPDDIVRSYRGLEGKLGEVSSKALTLPSNDAKDEDWNAFYAKVGRPEKPEGYEFKLPEGLPDNFPYQQDSATKFKNWAHSAGLTPRQSQTLHDQFVKDQAAQLGAMQENQVKAAAAAHDALVKVWGDPSTETYKRNQELANRTIRQQGGTELLKELQGIGALGPNGEVKTPRLAQMLAKTGESLFAEDSLFAGPGSVPNPFSDKSGNMTEAGRVIRSDPSRARQMILAAGKDPAEWGL